MFYHFIYLAKGFRMRPQVRSALNKFPHFIIKFKIPVHWIKVCFCIRYKSEGKVVPQYKFEHKKWSLVFEDRWSLTAGYSNTVNALYNVGVGPQWLMMLKWIFRCNNFLLFRPQEEKTQNKCAAISTWFPNP